MFKALNGHSFTIRLLDPPLHEFIPHNEEDIKKLAEELNIDKKVIHDTIIELAEVNPMLGHRGLRLAVTYPEIYRMQVRAIMEAAIKCKKEGISVHPEIMIPLSIDRDELNFVKKEIMEEINMVFEENSEKIDYKVGTMIETPRATILAGEIAKVADFFSYGTNDLTQMTYGFSRDDSGKFINEYIRKGIFEKVHLKH